MVASALMEVQGNVLIPFPQDHQAFLLLNFEHAAVPARWLAGIAPKVTLTADLRPAPGSDEYVGVCCGIGLTAAGILAISDEAGAGLAPFFAFRQGAAGRAPALRDRGPSGPDDWVFGGPSVPDVHAILHLAASDAASLNAGITWHKSWANHVGIQVVYRQDCAKLTGALADCEHFGFRDGLSQPYVWRDEAADAASTTSDRDRSVPVGEFVLGQLRAGESEHPRAARLVCPDWMLNGSFQVIRRLNQDVMGWRRQIDRLWHELGASDSLTRELIAAKLIGRWPSGTPLATAPDRDTGGATDAPFDFDGDREGFVTPRFAHIRKMLPRISGFHERDWRRIIRRGVPFGPPWTEAEQSGPDAPERGLLLVAYMADIDEQFEFLVRSWANDPDFAEAGDGPDPVIGRADAPAVLRRRGAPACPLRLDQHVTTTGGVYAFVPAASGLRWLAGLDPGT